jgi:hypothetical protein
MYYVYEPQYVPWGWQDQANLSPWSWYDRNLADANAGVPLFVNTNLFFSPIIEIEIFPQLVVNVSRFFAPRVFVVKQPDHMLKNEIRRITFLSHEK